MNDFASKLPNNVARLAALLSYYTEGECAIKKEYVENAWLLLTCSPLINTPRC